MNDPIRILGIDPGSRITGYGIVDTNGATTRYVASGCLKLGAGEFSRCLREIFLRISDLVSEYAPNHIAIEQVFVHKNADSALKLGHARAAAICATFAGGAAFHEYAAREIKQAVVGSGGAEKHQIQHMVKAILTLESLPVSDEADALAVALCHAHSFRLHAGLTSLTSAPRRSAGRSSWRKFAG
ncbi:MAG: crossover junction endodeoxyribonuclease RuvC [Gammaproteobacteria bacterium]|nr:crossover junction endodeoxyribonuclease RuvC [Gammaproteobacteria bacterium]